jgi:sigma-B regulation protein RsbU (phosphoserine phosphatase)
VRPHRIGIRWRVILTTLAGAGLVLAFIIFLDYHSTKKVVLVEHKKELLLLAQNHATKLYAHMLSVSQKPRGLAQALEVMRPKHEDDIYRLLTRFMNGPPPAYGMAVAYKPGAFRPDLERFSPYVHRNAPSPGQAPAGSRSAFRPPHPPRPEGSAKPGAPTGPSAGPLPPVPLRRTNLDNPKYNYPEQDWFRIPISSQRASWTEPYFDEGGGEVLMTTVSMPFHLNGEIAGVVTADLSVHKLGEEVQNMKVGRDGSGWAFLITQSGNFLAERHSEHVMRESVFTLAEKANHPELKQLGQRMIKGESGIIRIPNWHRDGYVWVAFAPVKGPNWAFGVVISEAEIMAPVTQLAYQSLAFALAGLAALLAVVFLVGSGLTKPLEQVAQSAKRLATGDLSAKVSGVRPGDEVGDLAESFNTMVDDLNSYVLELTTTTAAKERIESELELARQIQQSILPRTYPAFPHRSEFDLYGVTRPAREVGGDFYDFFMIDDEHLGLVVGDVSGKGVPAAFFMTIARTLIKNAAGHYQNPVEILNEANAQVVEDNPMYMFVTVFCGVYHIPSGSLRFARAGHPPPLLRRANGEVSALPLVEGIALGVVDDMGLEPGEVWLEPGDVILSFTDGLDEAVNGKDEMFGIPRAKQWLKSTEPVSAPEMIEALVKHQSAFTGPVEQFDDLTLLMMRRLS